jgi:hypothetical protein
VKARISAKSGDGHVIFSHTEEPYFFTFGKSEVPKGLEIGIGTMARKEKAVIYVRKQYLTESPLLHIDQDLEEVHFEVELVHFIQVRDMLGDGRLIKRRIRDGRGMFHTFFSTVSYLFQHGAGFCSYISCWGIC